MKYACTYLTHFSILLTLYINNYCIIDDSPYHSFKMVCLCSGKSFIGAACLSTLKKWKSLVACLRLSVEHENTINSIIILRNEKKIRVENEISFSSINAWSGARIMKPICNVILQVPVYWHPWLQGLTRTILLNQPIPRNNSSTSSDPLVMHLPSP